MISKRQKLLQRLFISYVVIVSLCLAAAWLLMSDLLRTMYFNETETNLKTQALFIEDSLPHELSRQNADAVNRHINNLGETVNTRITVILADGTVIADSDNDFQSMDNHRKRPEIIEAFNGGVGVSTRYSNTLKKDLMYVAIPLRHNNDIIAVVRTSTPIATIKTALYIYTKKIAFFVILIAISAAIASFIVSQWIVRPIGEIIKGVSRFASGDLSYRIPISSNDELGTLTESINVMAEQLFDRVREITEQQSELEAILSGMAEAIIVVDTNMYVIEFNQAASKYFDIDPRIARGAHIGNVIDNAHLSEFAKATLSENSLLEDEIVLEGNGNITLQAHGTQFLDASNMRVGGIIVLNDISRIKQLENIRREFVANVSHELKTPITSIMGFVETLNDGAINDFENRQQFLQIIMKHARRLNSIIDDLLSISRLEAASDASIEMSDNNLNEILKNAVSICEKEAKAKNIDLMLDCDSIKVKCNSALLEQAVVNLVDNAVKYSEPGTVVNIEGIERNGAVIIAVSDQGFGIPEDSIPRIFERFYRIDKGRSRASGGTGLGLSIVKHIINAHNGRIEVKSTPNKGSVFTISLPAVQ